MRKNSRKSLIWVLTVFIFSVSTFILPCNVIARPSFAHSKENCSSLIERKLKILYNKIPMSFEPNKGQTNK